MSTPDRHAALQSGSGPSWSGSGPLPEGPATDAVTFGRFQVLGEAGCGAMGVVYAAYDPQLDRRVALKVLRGEANRGEARERTRREAVALAQVNHPNVVTVFDVGEASRRLFIAMEYVAGPTLKAWLGDGQPAEARMAVLEPIARGLAAAHAQGLIHRDVKPSNVLIGPTGRPKIIDFGLARAGQGSGFGDGDGVLSSDLTRTGRLLGTPAYMAPELMDGGTPSHESDQFSFCVAAYEVLFGVRPFPADSLPVLRHAIERGRFTRPEVGDCPNQAALLEVLRRGLAPDPAARWPTMEALAKALAGAIKPQLAAAGAPVWIFRGLFLCAAIGVVGIYPWAHEHTGWLVLRSCFSVLVFLALRQALPRRVRAHPDWQRAQPLALVATPGLLLSSILSWRLDLAVNAAYVFDLFIQAAAFVGGYMLMRPPSALPAVMALVGLSVAAIWPDWAVPLNFATPIAVVALIGWTERGRGPQA